MTIGSRAVTELKEPEGALLFNLGRFPSGVTSALDRIPSSLPGVYSWYRAFNYSVEPTNLLEQLTHDLNAPKFIERSGSIKPYYDVTIRSKSWFNDTKVGGLKLALEDPLFRRGLLKTLSLSVLLQAPLYIGKAIDLRKRISTHLKEGSLLRERLSQAGTTIDRTLLFIIPNPESISTIPDEPPETVNDEYPQNFDDCDEDDTPSSYELLYEEIYSRLFNPQFTIRLG
jgi:hypothetical protein